MKRKLFQKAVCLILSVTLLLGVFGVSASAGATTVDKINREDTVTSLKEMQQLVGIMSYEEYLKANGEAVPNSGLGSLFVDITNFDGNGEIVSASKDCLDSFYDNQTLWQGFEEEGVPMDSEESVWNNSVYLPASGSSTWTFNVPDGAEGYYYIKIQYYSCSTRESSVSSIERKLLLDGNAPFDEASYITLNKNWSYMYGKEVDPLTGVAVPTRVVTEGPFPTNLPNGTTVEYQTLADGYYKIVTAVKDGYVTTTKYQISQDINGNSMAPAITQTPAWNTYFCKDSTGFYDGYFRFYLTDDDHRITLSAEREPVIIKSIEFVPYEPLVNDVPTYAEVLREYEEMGYQPATGNVTIIQAEFPDYVSDSSVAATNDNSSVANYPTNSKAQVYNVIGENSYNALGQWAAYKFTVNDTGLYRISMRYLQSTLQGMYVCRSIKLAGGIYGLEDGTPEVPFKEAYDMQFNYDKAWVSDYVTDSNDTDFQFYFEEGVEYTIYLECSLGSLKDLIKRVENTMNSVNECYLKILQLTGSAPDEGTDYNFDVILPEVLIEFLIQAIELSKVKDELEDLCGTNGAHIATLETVAILLDKMGSEDGRDIAANMSNLKSYLGTLGTWINDSKKGTLIVDSISIVPVGATEEALKAIPEADAGFFESLWHEILSFIYSFFVDYEAMGLTTAPDPNTPAVDVWLASGRDQSNIWRSMIDATEGFTSKTGTAVTLKLVTAGTLLPSILSGKGPDVYIGLGSADVINYAIREAVVGISGNDPNLSANENAVFTNTYYTFKDDTDRLNPKFYTISRADFDDEATFVSKYNEYASKYELTFTSEDFETNVFGNEYYTFKDEANDKSYTISTADYLTKADFQAAYNEYNSKYTLASQSKDPNYVPAAMDTVQLQGISYGLPQTMTFAMLFYRMDVLAELGQDVPETWDDILSILPALQTNNMSMGIDYISALDFMMYQRGGNMWKYTDDIEYAGSKINLDDPIAIDAFDFVCSLYSDYSFPISYDAANRFRTGEMPIIVGAYISLYNTLTVYATEIDGMWSFCPLPGSKLEDGSVNYNSLASITATVILHGCDKMLSSWQFMQWQSSAEVQASYGNQMVALIGPSAKYEAANINAIKDLSWTADERKAIECQMQNLSSIVNYPGSYIIARYMKFAFLDAVNDGADPKDAMMNYIGAINDEVTRKREEFGLPTLGPDQTPESVRAEKAQSAS